ncbi:MAG: MFS transporter [Candidatus Heimdallarchaeota archaeon]|nr:MFS transporter [Candidatus Heimdallarchaeota archaeon]MBY8994256.1 MFS transporter [Candidatus Heimdallarchaeota archaeon]
MNETKGNNAEKQQVSSRQRSYMGLTKAGGDLLGVMFTGALLTFYVDILGMDPELFGIVMIIFAVWNAINDPVFGYISDKKSLDSKGKRLYFIRLAAPIFLVGFLMFWIAFPSWSNVSLFIFLLIALFIFDTGLTIYGLNLSAILTGQTTSTNERTRISIITSVISFLPVGIAAILPNLVLTSEMAIVYMRLIFIGMTVIAAILMLIGTMKMKEHSLRKEKVEPLPVWPAIKETFKSKAFIFFVIINFMFTAISTNLVGVMPLYFKYIAQLNQWQILAVSAPIGILQIPFYFLYGYLQRKLGLRNSVFIIIGVMLVGFLGLFFQTHIVVNAISYALCLLMISFWFVIVNPLVGDIADEDELKTGRRREGMFFGINALITKPASSLVVFFFTLIISHFGYDSDLAVQTAQAQFGIILGLSILSLAFIVLAIVPLIIYPLHGSKLKEIKQELDIRHEKKQEEENEEKNYL